MNTELIEVLTDFYNGKRAKTLIINNPILRNIQHNVFNNVLERVWACGYLDEQITSISIFACVNTDNVLLINDRFCGKKEKKFIKNNLKIPFKITSRKFPY